MPHHLLMKTGRHSFLAPVPLTYRVQYTRISFHTGFAHKATVAAVPKVQVLTKGRRFASCCASTPDDEAGLILGRIRHFSKRVRRTLCLPRGVFLLFLLLTRTSVFFNISMNDPLHETRVSIFPNPPPSPTPHPLTAPSLPPLLFLTLCSPTIDHIFSRRTK